MKSYELKSERVAKLREGALAKTPGVCVERARYLTKAYKENEEKSKYMKRALAVKEVLENMSIYMKDGELVVGNQASDDARHRRLRHRRRAGPGHGRRDQGGDRQRWRCHRTDLGTAVPW